MKVSYYPNATAIFQFMMIFKSGNVALKPGPTAKALVEKKSCLVCSRTLARNHRAVDIVLYANDSATLNVARFRHGDTTNSPRIIQF